MKKFLIFLVAIVVVVSFGLTIFYFVRNDEVINFTTKVIYCNAGDIITGDELGLTVKKRNKKTTYNYNAAEEEVTNVVKYDSEHGYYVVSKDAKGGKVTITIKTSNKKSPKFDIDVYIGDGASKETPFYISDAEDLLSMNDLLTRGNGSGNYYKLLNDITLTSAFTPIGASNFIGNFDGNGHTISGLDMVNGTYTDAGLFASMKNATVENLTLANVTISGNYTTAGALAGKMENSIVDRVAVKNAKITSEAGTIGGLVGVVSVSNDDYVSEITRSYVDESSTLTGNGTIGGLVGELNRSSVKVSYAKPTISSESGYVGGFVGKFKISEKSGSIQQSYSYASIDSASATVGSFIGEISASQSEFHKEQAILPLYLVGNYALDIDGKAVVHSNTTTLTELNTLENTAENIYRIAKKSKEAFESGNIEDFVFYAIAEQVFWDGEYTWSFSKIATPALKMAQSPLPTIDSEFALQSGVTERLDSNTALRDALNGAIAPGTKFNFTSHEYNMAGLDVAITEKTLQNVTFVGSGAVIKNLTVNGYLFDILDNCIIRDITFENLTFKTQQGSKKPVGLINEVKSTSKYTSSLISGVKITYGAEIAEIAENFGGIAATLSNGSTISNCEVSGLTVDCNGGNVNLAGVVAIVNDGKIENSKVNVNLAGGNVVAGVVAQNNNGNIIKNEITAKLSTKNAQYVGGIVGANNSYVDGNTADVTISVVASTKADAKVGGAAAQNFERGTISNTTLKGEGIVFDLANKGLENFTSAVYVGGVVAENKGTISEAENLVATVGNYTDETERDSILGKNFFVGGVAYSNSGNISKAVVTSNIAGNTVAGAVVSTSGSVDQVLVGFNTTTGKRNTLEGDKFVAGVAYEITATGKVTNIQTRSLISGKTEDTKSSLVVLKFPNGAVFANGSINNAAEGLGTLYKETWADYQGGKPQYYNLFGASNASGSFTSVVINTSNIEGTLKVKQAFFNWGLMWWPTDYSLGNTNFFNYVGDDAFTNIDTFTGKTTITADNTNGTIEGGNNAARGLRKESYTYDLTFGSEWTIQNGASLAFLGGNYAE